VKGDTPYSLSKKYGATVDDINKLNPDLAGGFKIGQQVKIPLKAAVVEGVKPVTTPPTPVKTTVSFSDTVITYVVKPSETLYTIAKRYMVPVNELQAFNQLKTTKIKEGDTLKIPLKKEQIKEVPIREVKPLEEVKKIDKSLLFKQKEKYEIAVLLPFDLDSKGSTQLKTLATDFYMGVELAIDSLKALGFDANVRIIDFPSDSAKMVAALKKPEMKNLDLIIGPLLPQSTEMVANWCKTNQVRMVCPASVNSAVLKGNQYVYAAVSSEMTQQAVMAKYVIENYKNDQIVLVNAGITKDKDLYDAFRNRFMELSKTNGNVKLIEIKAADVATYIRKNGNTVFIVPTRDKVAANKFVLAVHKSSAKAGDGAITIIGTKDWAGFDDISGYYKTKYAISWAASSDLNYTLEQAKQMGRLYRNKYKADLNKYAAQGFDVFYYFVQTLLNNQEVKEQVVNAFNMSTVAAGSGFENNQCFILKHVDYELIRVGIYHE
jgi:LysM repeat protein